MGQGGKKKTWKGWSRVAHNGEDIIKSGKEEKGGTLRRGGVNILTMGVNFVEEIKRVDE